MGNALELATDDLKKLNTYSVLDDFDAYVSGGRWTALAADSGASVAGEDYSATYAFNGSVLLTTGGTNNNEATIYTTKKNFLLSNDKAFELRCRLQFTEAATNAANVFFGFTSAPGADLMVDDGAGPATSMSGCGWYKVDSSSNTNWNTIVSLGSTQTLTQMSATNSATKAALSAIGGGVQTLGIKGRYISSTQVEVEFLIDTAGGNNLVLASKQTFTYTSAAAMGVSLYVKCGTSASQTLRSDYILIAAKR